MDILMKYAKKKTVFILSTVLSGIVTILYLISKFGSVSTSSNTSINDLDSIANMIGSMITVVQIVFYAFVILAIATAILSGVYFFKKNKQEYVMLGEFIASCINSALLLLSISGVNAICRVVRVAISGDYSSLMSLDSVNMLSSITSAASNLKYFMYLSIIVFILNMVVLLIAKKVINIQGFTFTFDEVVSQANDETVNESQDTSTGEIPTEPSSSNASTTSEKTAPTIDSEKLKTATKDGVNKIKDFIKTKNGKITLGVIIAVIIVFGGYKIYDKFFNYTSIDLTSDITIKFDGKDGKGYISDFDYKIDYDKSNDKLVNFVDSVYPDYEYSSDLSNGDDVVIKMKYSKETAKANNIKVTSDSKTFKVKGLIESYKKASDLPKKLISTLETEAADEIKDKYTDRSSYTYKTEFDSLWFAKAGKSSFDDQAIAVYKLDSTYTSSFSGEQTTETSYVISYVDDVDSGYLKDSDKHYWYTTHLYDSAYNRLNDPSGIEDALRNKFDDYTLEKIK